MNGLPSNEKIVVINRPDRNTDDSKQDSSKNRDNEIQACKNSASVKMAQMTMATWCTKKEDTPKVHYPYSLLYHFALLSMDHDITQVEQVVEDEVFRILNSDGCRIMAKIPSGYWIPEMIAQVQKLIHSWPLDDFRLTQALLDPEEIWFTHSCRLLMTVKNASLCLRYALTICFYTPYA